MIWQHLRVAPFGTRVAGPLRSGHTYLRWVYLLVGGAFLLAYVTAASLLANVVAEAVPLPATAGTVFLVVALPVVTAFLPAVRVVEVAAANALLGTAVAVPGTPEAGGGREAGARWRTAGCFLLHLLLGGVASTATMILPPTAVVLGAAPLLPGRVVDLPGDFGWVVDGASDTVLTLLAGLVLLVAPVYLVAGLGAVLARVAPTLLGPSAGERMAALERHAEQLAERNRLARELHDSVGHALGIVGIQAGAAGRVLDRDPAFARQALATIEEAARTAMADLDHVLGLLREEAASTAPQPTLRDLDTLLRTTRSAGVDVDADVSGDLDQVPQVVSREAYRIVQEGLTNALRHAGRVPVSLRLAVGGEWIEVELVNPLAGRPRRRSPARRGGRGLRGIGERVAILGGDVRAEAERERWRIAVRLPLRPGGSTP